MFVYCDNKNCKDNDDGVCTSVWDLTIKVGEDGRSYCCSFESEEKTKEE